MRSLFFGTGPHALFDARPAKGRADRVTPLLALIESFRAAFALPGAPHATRGRLAFGSIRLETPDTNDGKELSGLCRAIEKPLADALRDRASLVTEEARAPALHVLFVDGANAYLGREPRPLGQPVADGHPAPANAGRRAVALDA